MYYYALLDSYNICYDIMESDTPITDDPYCVQIDSYDKSYIYRKKYIDGVWEDTTAEEAQQFEGSHIGIFGEWLDVVINNKADVNHIHDGYATKNHSHTEYASSDELQVLEDMIGTKADITHSHSEYSPLNHSHNNYATQIAVDTLSEEVENKADANHSHIEYALATHEHNYASSNHNHNETYAPLSHSHSNYVETTNFDTLEAKVENKADNGHTHSNYSETTHKHDNIYSPLSHSHTASEIGAAVSGHNHDADYADIGHNHTGVYSEAAHNHNEDYAAIDHSHSNYATVTSLDELSATVTGKANTVHNHNDLYYTESEINSKLASKSDTSHNHNGVYDVSGSAASALTTANEYTDSKIDAIDIPSTLSELTADSTHRLVTDAEKAAWNAKSNFSGSYNDLTNKPTIPSISGLATETYVDEAVSGKANVGHTHGDIYYTESEVNSLLAGKANSTHNHNSSYDALGTAEAKASAVQANLDVVSEELTEHIDNDAIHFTAAERTKLSGIAANANNYTLPSAGATLGGVKSGGDVTISSGVITVNDDSHNHIISNVDGLQSALDGKASSSHNHDNTYYIQSQVDTKDSETLSSAQAYADNLNTTMNSRMNSVENKLNTIASNAEVNQNAFTNVVVGSTTIAADSKTDTLTIAAGTGVSISPDATNDKVTITNSGVRSIATGSANGTISVNTNGTSANVAVKGLGSAAYTDSTAYDVAGAADIALDAAKEYTDSVASGKANTSHTHTIANITNLQSTLDGKAATSHGTHVSYSTTAPTMDGSASVGTASTVARSDHKHPTDTSRAAQTSLDSHTSNKSNPHAVTLAQLGVTATAAELNKMDGVTATTAELNILNGVTATTAELNYVDGVTSNIQTQLNSKASSSHTHSAATTSAAGLMSASDKSKLDGIASGANKYTLPTASSTLGGVKTTSTVTSNSGYTACPIIEGVPYYKDTNTTYSLGSFGVTATAAELNYVDGVTSNIQTQLDGKAASSHGTHVTYGATAPKANGTAAVGTASTVSRSDHVHPLQTTVSGNAGTATKLATARTISLTGDVTGSTSFDGSGNVSITATVADDSHNHIISNVDGLQAALDEKSATSHNHNSAYIKKDLQFTGDNGGVIISYNKDDGKNLLTELAALPIGFYTVYSQSGVTGNPKTTEAWRFIVHKTSASAGWVQGYGSIGSVYTNYIDGTNGWRGWRCIWDNDPNPLWSGQYYMSSPNSTPQTVTPSKKLSECRTGWLLLWSDYDPGSGSNDSDFVTTIIPKNDPSGNKWGGKSFLCDIPRYVGSNAEDVDTERRIIKPIYVHDDCIKGSYQNDKDERNDVVLRAVYEI